MRRTIEKLAQTRRDKEDEFSKKAQDLKERAATLDPAGLAGALVELLQLQNEIADARDKEWDALGSNHVGMVFKSMEWRVDKLAAAYEDVSGPPEDVRRPQGQARTPPRPSRGEKNAGPGRGQGRSRAYRGQPLHGLRNSVPRVARTPSSGSRRNTWSISVRAARSWTSAAAGANSSNS